MGILNITPDSFSDGGVYFNQDDAVQHALELIDGGVDIIDIGGESTKPGSDFISIEEELKRVIPTIKDIMKYRPNAILSIDTNKSPVAEAALECGVKIVNDVFGGTNDENIFNVVAKYNAVLVLMHILETPKTMQLNPSYDDLILEINDFFITQIKKAKDYGVTKIILDPGIGFGKTVNDNFEIIKQIAEFKKFGYPVLIGLSRKSFIGKSLSLEMNQRDFPTSILETIAIKNGVNIIRTHNYQNAMQIKKIFSLLVND